VAYVDYINHIIECIKQVMDEFGIEVKTLSSSIRPQESQYQKILEVLKGCIVGIVILDGLRPNVIFEYGILLGLDKPVIAFKDEDAVINVESLYTDNDSKQKLKEARIENPKLDIDKHLSDIKDLHWISYNRRYPDRFRELLKDNFIRMGDKISKEIIKPMTTKEIALQKPKIYNEFQQAFGELAEYVIKLKKLDYKEIKTLDKKIDNLSKKYKIELSPYYYLALGHIYGELFKYDDALRVYERIIKTKPDDADAWFNKGLALSGLRRYEEALKAFERQYR